MATLKQLREGLATRLRTVDGLGQVSEYRLANLMPPCAYIKVSKTERLAMGRHSVALRQVTFAVNVLMAAGLEEASQLKLDELVDSGAIPDALEADQTLGGVAGSVYVSGVSEYDPVSIGENQAGWRATYEVLVTES